MKNDDGLFLFETFNDLHFLKFPPPIFQIIFCFIIRLYLLALFLKRNNYSNYHEFPTEAHKLGIETIK